MRDDIIKAFKDFLPCDWEPQADQITALEQLFDFASIHGFSLNEDYESVFIEAVNQKLDLNKSIYKKILDKAFFEKIKLNYFLKSEIRKLLDSCDVAGYCDFLSVNNIDSSGMRSVFTPVSKSDTHEAVSSLYKTDAKYLDVYCSIFSRFCFHLFAEECSYRFFSGESDSSRDYFDFIEKKYPDIMDRSNALYFLDVPENLFTEDYSAGCNILLNSVKEAFSKLNNHCDMVIYIPKIFSKGEDVQWKLFSDIVLFSEKHIKGKIDRTYFRWQKIGKQTIDYIRNIGAFNAEFEFAFQGFVFKDCFILGKADDPYSLLLIFEKNVRDERIVNCPACRSINIQGNSYPILNVRSWECENPLCPDRSKYNRGKRYAFMSLFRQREMLNDENVIPDESISKWHLDCQHVSSKIEALEMIVRHYSCVNDTITIVSQSHYKNEFLNRHLRYEPFSAPKTNLLSDFKSSAYFYRYIQYDDRDIEACPKWESGNATVICGDSLDALRQMPHESISCAVTSPPYYNAKSYSQWPNIYCYLYDMFNINSEVYRVLKEGAVYLYNIFDYFDNENNIVLSAMGNKRMILGAYMIDMFERIGFRVCGNIIWNKGEIQGNRSFNQGNLTPYYQAPLNCWEHILVLSKGQINEKYKSLSSCIVDIKPVIKMIRGKNVLGHDAPYPYDIPNLLVKCMDQDDIVLDPFLGSGTTCIVANHRGRRSIGIEKSEKYFELCKRLISEDYYQTELFEAMV
jgi:modification methylase bslI